MEARCSLLPFPSSGALGKEQARFLPGASPVFQPSWPPRCTRAPLALAGTALPGTGASSVPLGGGGVAGCKTRWSRRRGVHGNRKSKGRKRRSSRSCLRNAFSLPSPTGSRAPSRWRWRGRAGGAPVARTAPGGAGETGRGRERGLRDRVWAAPSPAALPRVPQASRAGARHRATLGIGGRGRTSLTFLPAPLVQIPRLDQVPGWVRPGLEREAAWAALGPGGRERCHRRLSVVAGRLRVDRTSGGCCRQAEAARAGAGGQAGVPRAAAVACSPLGLEGAVK